MSNRGVVSLPAWEKGICPFCYKKLGKIEIIKRYKELGGEIITIGSDAHSPEYVASHIKDAYEILRNVGLKAFTIFEKQQPYFIDIPKI